MLLQLRETLEIVERDYLLWWNGYFAIVSKSMIYTFAVDANPELELRSGLGLIIFLPMLFASDNQWTITNYTPTMIL